MPQTAQQCTDVRGIDGTVGAASISAKNGNYICIVGALSRKLDMRNI
jgi:hypothetical protein